jgi:uncharacterized protein (DUF2249 family)
MTTIPTISTTRADASAIDAIEDHHVALLGALSTRVDRLVTVAGLEGMHGALTAATPHHEAPHHEAGDEVDEDMPELDARIVPHAIRHATIFGALDAVRPGQGMVLVAPHDPLPLLAQIEERTPGAFSVSYLARGPEAWRLQFSRTS